MSRPHTQAVYRYWQAKRGDRLMPSRADIDPAELPPEILPGICLIAVVSDARRYVYRLVGILDVEVRGKDPTGDSVLEAYFGPSRAEAVAHYDQVVSTRAPMLDQVPIRAPNGRFVTEEAIFLPLSDDGIRVDKILVYAHSRLIP
jgi:hypothetical protein